MYRWRWRNAEDIFSLKLLDSCDSNRPGIFCEWARRFQSMLYAPYGGWTIGDVQAQILPAVSARLYGVIAFTPSWLWPDLTAVDEGFHAHLRIAASAAILPRCCWRSVFTTGGVSITFTAVAPYRCFDRRFMPPRHGSWHWNINASARQR